MAHILLPFSDAWRLPSPRVLPSRKTRRATKRIRRRTRSAMPMRRAVRELTTPNALFSQLMDAEEELRDRQVVAHMSDEVRSHST